MSPGPLPQDSALPQLAQALDAPAMALVLAAAVRPGLVLLGCQIERIKYRPQRNLSVSYRLTLREGDRLIEQRVAGRFCSGGDAARRHATALQRDWLASPAGPGISHHPSLGLLAHWWPNDAKYPAPALLADHTAMRQRWLPELVQAAFGRAEPLLSHQLRVVQAVPEQRVTAYAELQLADGRFLKAYAKADVAGGGATTDAVMRALWHSPARLAGRLALPQPLLWQAEAGLHWQRAVPGQALMDAVAADDTASAGQVGALVAALHHTPVPTARRSTADALRQRPHDVAQQLALVLPALQPRLQALAERLARVAETLAQQPEVTLHGDLHPRNLLLHEGRLCLIDLDSVHRGPAALDLGSWLADTLLRALLAGAPTARALQAGQAFIAAYRGHAADAPAEPLLAYATAYQLLCERAWRCVVNLKPGRLALVEPLLALAESLLQAGRLDAAQARLAEAA